MQNHSIDFDRLHVGILDILDSQQRLHIKLNYTFY